MLQNRDRGPTAERNEFEFLLRTQFARFDLRGQEGGKQAEIVAMTRDGGVGVLQRRIGKVGACRGVEAGNLPHAIARQPQP